MFMAMHVPYRANSGYKSKFLSPVRQALCSQQRKLRFNASNAMAYRV